MKHQEITAVLGKIGAAASWKNNNYGWRVHQVNQRCVAVFFDSFINSARTSTAMRRYLEFEGFIIDTPYEDKTILAVTGKTVRTAMERAKIADISYLEAIR